jgi:hypothetical protein
MALSHRSRISRIIRHALAYLAIAALLAPYAWFFFWCKNLFPRSLLYPTSWIWLIMICRILLQLVVSLAVLVPSALILTWFLGKLLTPDELRRLSAKWGD